MWPTTFVFVSIPAAAPASQVDCSWSTSYTARFGRSRKPWITVKRCSGNSHATRCAASLAWPPKAITIFASDSASLRSASFIASASGGTPST